MKTLLINASPKKIASASSFFLSLLRIQMNGITGIFGKSKMESREIKLTGPAVYGEIFRHFETIDALVIALPVYVDGVPSHALDFMTAAEAFCREKGCHFKLYVVSNCGFIEGRQCKNLLANMHSFCYAAGLTWGGGVGIGGGEMLNVLKYTMLYLEVFKLVLSLPVFLLQGDLAAGLIHYPWISTLIPLSIYLLLNLGLLSAMWKIYRTIRSGKQFSDFYLRVPLPKFLFIVFANGYFIFRAAYHGTGFLRIYHKSEIKHIFDSYI